uniref:Ig-like domain-containing protein n=1 Tax=Peromyscus maniculatus bairdii TaxID=230844 RepID=A0A8C8W6W0_PERMB
STQLVILVSCVLDFYLVRTIFLLLGIYKKPFLLALQPPLVNLGEKVTLECRSEIMFETFTLTSHKNGTIKDSFELSAEHFYGGSQVNFSIGPVTPDDAGTYTCYGSFNHSPYEWSESSDPIDIKITGLYKKPSLSALIEPVVMSGENMTLTCFSDLQFDMNTGYLQQGTIDAMALSGTLPICGQPQVTACTFFLLSPEPSSYFFNISMYTSPLLKHFLRCG